MLGGEKKKEEVMTWDEQRGVSNVGEGQRGDWRSFG